MLAEILWWYGAKRQYDMQKENGLAGLIGIFSVLFIVWQWDNLFYPIFNALGLVNVFKNAGLVNENLTILTVINVLATLFLLMMIVAFITAIPMFFVMLLFTTFGEYNPKKPTALQYALSIALLPILLVLFVIWKVLRTIRFIPNPPKTINKYVKENPEMAEVVRENNFNLWNNNKRGLADLYAIQQTNLNDPITATKLSRDEVISLLNRAIPYLNENRYYAFGYKESINQWYLLLPNPIPWYASIAIARTNEPEETPFHYKMVSHNYSMYRSYTYTSAYRPDFFTPAVHIEFDWNPEKELITLNVPEDDYTKPHITYNGTVVNVDELDYIVKLEGESIQFFYAKAVDDKGVVYEFERAHAYAYIIPIPYQEGERNLYKAETTNEVVSYYKELQKIPGAMEHSYKYQDAALKHIKLKASANYKWAKDYLKQREQEHSND